MSSFLSLLSGNQHDREAFEQYLTAFKVDELLKDILTQLSINKPDRPVNFIRNYLKNRPEPEANTSSDSEMQDNEEDTLPEEIPSNLRNRKRRGAVSSEPASEVDASAGEIVSHPKTEAQMQSLREALSGHILCSHLDHKELNEVFDAMFEESYKAGEKIITQGDDGDRFYVIHKGECDIYVNTSDSEPKHVQHLEDGGTFGELALIYNTPRAADVIAKTDIQLWAIDRVTYRRVLMNSTIRKRKMYEEFLDKVPILSPLQKYERLTVADALEPIQFEKGEVIVRQGEQGDVFYIIIEGTADVTQIDRNGEEKKLVVLGPSDYFGEIALLTDRPRAATVTAVDTLSCVRLDRGRFNRVLGPCEDILRRNMNAYNLYMAKQI